MESKQQIGGWYEDLIECPSQCYYYFYDPLKKKNYCIYLRYRNYNPYTAELIECDENLEFVPDIDWEVLPISIWENGQHRELEEEVLRIINDRLPISHQLENKVYFTRTLEKLFENADVITGE